MVHRDPALHRCDRGEGVHPGAVACGVDPAHGGARDPVGLDVAGVPDPHSGGPETQVRGPGDPTERHQHVAAGDLLARGEGDHHPVVGAAGGFGARAGAHGHAATREGVLEHVRGVRVGAGQHLLAGGDERDLATERPVGARELGAGHARAHDDQVLGQAVQLVQLGPVQDPLSVAGGGLELAGPRADGQQDHVVLMLAEALPCGIEDLDPVGPVEPAAAVDQLHPRLREARADVRGLRGGEVLDPAVHGGEVDVEGLPGGGRAGVGVADAQLRGPGHLIEHVRGGDEGLRGHHVGEDRGAAQAPLLDQDGRRAVACGGQRGLVAARSAAHDHHAGTVSRAGDASRIGGQCCAGIAHPAIVTKTGRWGAVFRHWVRTAGRRPARCEIHLLPGRPLPPTGSRRAAVCATFGP